MVTLNATQMGWSYLSKSPVYQYADGFLAGDLNSRTSCLSDYITNDNVDYIFHDNDTYITDDFEIANYERSANKFIWSSFK